MLRLNKFSVEVHENSHAHGWWEKERSKGEILALVHSEISEALEEYRAARPLLWASDYEGEKKFEDMDSMPDGAKPEGIAVELIDCCIRILDYLCAVGVSVTNGDTIDELIENTPPEMFKVCEAPFPEFITFLHSLVSEAYVLEETGEAVKPLLCAQALIYDWCRQNGANPEKIMIGKHEFNKKRPYKHGGKVC